MRWEGWALIWLNETNKENLKNPSEQRGSFIISLNQTAEVMLIYKRIPDIKNEIITGGF